RIKVGRIKVRTVVKGNIAITEIVGENHNDIRRRRSVGEQVRGPGAKGQSDKDQKPVKTRDTPQFQGGTVPLTTSTIAMHSETSSSTGVRCDERPRNAVQSSSRTRHLLMTLILHLEAPFAVCIQFNRRPSTFFP